MGTLLLSSLFEILLTFNPACSVLEFMAGGQVVWQDDNKQPTLTVDEARRTFRDVVLGLEYCTFISRFSPFTPELKQTCSLVRQCTTKASFIETSSRQISYGQKITAPSRSQISEFPTFPTLSSVLHQTTQAVKGTTTRICARLQAVPLSSLPNSAILPNTRQLRLLTLRNLISETQTTRTPTSRARSIRHLSNLLRTTQSTLLRLVRTESPSLQRSSLPLFLSNLLRNLVHDLPLEKLLMFGHSE